MSRARTTQRSRARLQCSWACLQRSRARLQRSHAPFQRSRARLQHTCSILKPVHLPLQCTRPLSPVLRSRPRPPVLRSPQWVRLLPSSHSSRSSRSWCSSISPSWRGLHPANCEPLRRSKNTWQMAMCNHSCFFSFCYGIDVFSKKDFRPHVKAREASNANWRVLRHSPHRGGCRIISPHGRR
jgi:hypothetical protein